MKQNKLTLSSTYDDAGKLLSGTETEDNYGTYTYTYEYDLMGNRTAVVKTDENDKVAESRYYTYNESSQLLKGFKKKILLPIKSPICYNVITMDSKLYH